MSYIEENLRKLFTLMNIREPEVTIHEEEKRVSLVINDKVASSNLSLLLPALDHLFSLFLKKNDLPPYIIDINFYRKERERIIGELARTAAKKALMTQSDIELPPMNSYERRIVHTEITTHPELKTESLGVGKERRVVIKRIA